MEKVKIMPKEEFEILLSKINQIGEASSESIIYDLNNDFILKDLKDESLAYFKSPEDMIYTEEQLLRFSDIDVDSYYFGKSVIYVDDDLRCLIMKKCKGFVLNYIDPLSVKISSLLTASSKFSKDTLSISEKHILGYDMQSNFMYDGNRFGAIDTIHYDFSDMNEDKIFKSNIKYFNDEVAGFLVDLYFERFVKQDNKLNEAYIAVKNGELTNLNQFILLLEKKLSEHCDKKIIYLSDAKEVAQENDNPTYPCCPIYSL